MRRSMILLLTSLWLGSVATAQEVPTDTPPEGQDAPVEGQDAPADGVEDTGELLFAYSLAVEQAAEAWADSWADVPSLVSLQASDDAPAAVAAEELDTRLKRLGEKTYSNREWKAYWEEQGSTMTVLMETLRAEDPSAPMLSGMEQWVTLAENKVGNQDAFFEAIELERDALESRMEAILEATEDETDAVDVISEDPSPYEARAIRIAELERDVAAQQAKRAAAGSEIAYIERILETETILSTALATDLELARTELTIAQSMSGTERPWGRMWSDIAERTEAKVAAIDGELDYGRARKRSRDVEIGLVSSQVAFRDARLAGLQELLDEEQSLNSWLRATGATLTVWVRTDLWRIALGLLVVWLGVRFGKRLVGRTTKYVLHRADDDHETADDGDQRRETLAGVFLGVATIGIYIVGGLLALEQIGVNTAPLLGSVAILGLAISFGSQNLVRDVVNGFFILLENQYAVGDIVEINGKTGTVERITIRTTWLRSYNGDLHAIPNGGISLVSNLTRGWSRAVVEVGVGYGVDVDQVERVINELGGAMFADPAWVHRLEEAPVFVGVVALADSSVNVRIHVRVVPGEQWPVQREIFRRAKAAFDREGIEIPFPQRVLHYVPEPPVDADVPADPADVPK